MLGRVSATDYGMVHGEIQRGENDSSVRSFRKMPIISEGLHTTPCDQPYSSNTVPQATSKACE